MCFRTGRSATFMRTTATSLRTSSLRLWVHNEHSFIIIMGILHWNKILHCINTRDNVSYGYKTQVHHVFSFPSRVQTCTGSRSSVRRPVTILLKKWSTLESGQEVALWYENFVKTKEEYFFAGLDLVVCMVTPYTLISTVLIHHVWFCSSIADTKRLG